MAKDNDPDIPTVPFTSDSNSTKYDQSPDDPADVPLTTDACLGVLLKDRYLIDKVIGSGGIGVVYSARDRQLMNRQVVIKVIHQNLLGTELGEWIKKKFQLEIEALSRIDHPGVVGVFDTGFMPDGRTFLVMQYVDGMTLRSAIPAKGMDYSMIARLFRQIGAALNAAHDKGVLHRDIKPENIMLQDLGAGEQQVKLIDFGIAQVADPQSNVSATQVTKISGSVPYMAPEQLRGRPSKASDIYALGVIAYEMVTGVRPYEAETVVSLYDEQRTGPRRPMRELRPSLPAAAEASILKAMSFEKNDRHETAREFTDELSAILLDGGSNTPTLKYNSKSLAHEQPIKTQSVEGRPTVVEGETRVEAAEIKRGLPARLPVIGSILVLAVIALWIFMRTGSPAPEIPKPEAPATSIPERSVNYWATVQKYRDGRAYQDPFRLPGDILFEKDYMVRFSFSGAESGYLYLINEGPQPINNLPAYVLLFPKPSVNQGSAELSSGEEMSTPEFLFDAEEGTEKLWLVWANKPAPEIEAVKGVVNPQDMGAINNPDQIRSVESFLNRHYSRDKVSVIKDDVNKQMTVKANAEILVHLLKLEHH